ncbi:MAG: gephyrin-like molybdotransferase Glp [Albidovulum sp.]
MITVEEALERLFALCPILPEEPVALRKAAGRVLIRDVVAALNQPPFAASAMDGYAVHETDHSTGTRLKIVGESSAGKGFSGTVKPGEAVRIFTGAPVPEGAGRVVLQEDVTREGCWITLGHRLEAARNIRAAGQDFRVGDRVLAPRRLRPADLALIAAMNVPEVVVARRPVVAFVATGNELVMPGEAPGPDQIIASNGFALAAMAEAEGAEARVLPIARDDLDSIRFALELAADADLIVTIGGASVGDHDLIAPVTEAMGMERSFYKIAIRPGKPLMAGKLGSSALLGLPGNPVSAIVCGHVFMIPMLRAMQGLPPAAVPRGRARLAHPVEANGPRAHYMRARLGRDDSGITISAFEQQDSAMLSIFSQADALLIRPMHDPARDAGAEVDYLPL